MSPEEMKIAIETLVRQQNDFMLVMKQFLEAQLRFMKDISFLQEIQAKTFSNLERLVDSVAGLTDILGQVTENQSQLVEAQRTTHACLADLADAQRSSQERFESFVVLVKRYFGEEGQHGPN